MIKRVLLIAVFLLIPVISAASPYSEGVRVGKDYTCQQLLTSISYKDGTTITKPTKLALSLARTADYLQDKKYQRFLAGLFEGC